MTLSRRLRVLAASGAFFAACHDVTPPGVQTHAPADADARDRDARDAASYVALVDAQPIDHDAARAQPEPTVAATAAPTNDGGTHCGVLLPQDWASLDEVPKGWLVQALVPSVDRKTLLAKQHGTTVDACEGIDFDLGSETPIALGLTRRRLDATSNQFVLWVVGHVGGAGLADDFTGVLALAHLEGRRVVVDAKGHWKSNAAPERLEKHMLGGHNVYLEAQKREEGAGSGKRTNLWLERDRSLIMVGDIPEETSEFVASKTKGEDHLCDFVAGSMTWSDTLRVDGTFTILSRIGAEPIFNHVLRTSKVVRRFELSGDELHELHPQDCGAL